MRSTEYDWQKLDNAAIFFPSVSTVGAPNVFRLSCRLYEQVDPQALQKSVELALLELPYFKCRIHRGFFWYYLEDNPRPPIISEEQAYPCRKIDKNCTSGYLFSVLYYGNYIHLETFHALTDATGARELLMKIIKHYLIAKHPEDVSADAFIPDKLPSEKAQSEDSFQRITTYKKDSGKSVLTKKAYIASNTLAQNGEVLVLKGIMSVRQLKTAAKKYGVTISQYITAALIYSFYLESFRYEPVNKEISVNIPVNLRNFFDSDTLRNFFTNFAVSVNFYKHDYSFDDVVDIVAASFSDEIDAEKLLKRVHYNVKFQKNKAVRFIPLFLKNIVLKIIFNRSEQNFTALFSNIGVSVLPETAEKYVERIEFMTAPTLRSRYKTTAASYLDTFVFCFSTTVDNTDIQRCFFKLLCDDGVDITISTNSSSNEYSDKSTDAADIPDETGNTAVSDDDGGNDADD